ncbi:MAG: hypothetical protein ACKV19_07390 [Verrucomicrobiales bacterium]
MRAISSAAGPSIPPLLAVLARPLVTYATGNPVRFIDCAELSDLVARTLVHELKKGHWNLESHETHESSLG